MYRGRNQQMFEPIVTIDKPIELMSQRFIGLTDFGTGTIGQEFMAQSSSADAPFRRYQMPVEILGAIQIASGSMWRPII